MMIKQCTLRSGMLFMYGRLDKADKQRMGLVGAALEFRMELDANKEILFGQLDGFHQSSVRGQAREA